MAVSKLFRCKHIRLLIGKLADQNTKITEASTVFVFVDSDHWICTLR